ncbi:MAG TPA: CFI-box-CTERM domain-containing protein [Pyrinomonadaceae bacterium]|nr:CFI-box-CTERM domain-containing protein [Pyrinomonadaceae bacterium]
MSDYDEAVKKGAVYSPSHRPPGGTIADNIRKNRESGGGGSGGGSGGGCFVATAAFGDFNAPEVVFLRAFRDEWLSQSALGRGFIQAYYAVSPPLSEVIAKSESLRGFTRRFILRPTISLLRYFKHR